MSFRKNIKSEQGSVMLEFILVLPLYLLLFGGTFLTFDISMAKLHLQETNRNLTWLTGDRYDDGNIRTTLYKNVKGYYDVRNALESNLTSGTVGKFWDFGNREEGDWGHRIKKFKNDSIEISADNNWASLYSGNMELKMTKLSGVYIGAAAVSSVLFPNGETRPLYRSSYTLTRAVPQENGNSDEIPEANGESLLIHRKAGSDRFENKEITPLDITTLQFESWPSNGNLIDDARLILGL